MPPAAVGCKRLWGGIGNSFQPDGLVVVRARFELVAVGRSNLKQRFAYGLRLLPQVLRFVRAISLLGSRFHEQCHFGIDITNESAMAV
jgi:hypothetical protein